MMMIDREAGTALHAASRHLFIAYACHYLSTPMGLPRITCDYVIL